MIERFGVIVDGGLDEDARGMGHRADDANVEVRLPGVLPDEKVTARLVHRSHKGRCFAVPESIEVASPDRQEVGCPHFLDCGGCDFLHASMAAQHDFKRRAIADALGLDVEAVAPVVASPRATGYRALAKLVVGQAYRLGSYRPRSHNVVSMHGCVVHAPEAERIVDEVRGWLAGGLQPQLRYLIVRASLSEGRAVVTLVSTIADDPGVAELARRLGERDDVAKVVLNVNDGDGDALLAAGADQILVPGDAPVEVIGGVMQSLEAGAFSQVNPLAAERLYAKVAELIEPAGKSIIDLYAGSAGIALTLAHAGAKRVLAVESHADACAAAAQSAEQMGLSESVEVLEASVEQALLEVASVDAVVLNPPRKGASVAALELIAAQAPLRLVYVSCNPKSLARDVAILQGVAGVEVRAIVGVDMFPNTRHVETVWCADLRPAS